MLRTAFAFVEARLLVKNGSTYKQTLPPDDSGSLMASGQSISSLRLGKDIEKELTDLGFELVRELTAYSRVELLWLGVSAEHVSSVATALMVQGLTLREE